MPSHPATRRDVLRTGVILSTASAAGCLQGSTGGDEENESAIDDRQNQSPTGAPSENSENDAGAERTVPWSVELPRAPERLATTPSKSGLFGSLENATAFGYDLDGTRRWTIDETARMFGAVDDEHVYLETFRDGSAEVVAVATTSGDVQWRFPLPGSREDAIGVAATDSRVYALTVQGGGHEDPPEEEFVRLHALDPADGEHYWQQELPYHGEFWELAPAGDSALVAWERGQLRCFAPNGAQRWSRWFQDDPPGTEYTPDPVPSYSFDGAVRHESRIFLGVHRKHQRPMTRILSIQFSDGSTAWEYEGPQTVGVVTGDRVVCTNVGEPSSEETIIALDVRDGRVHWSEQLGDVSILDWGSVVESTVFLSVRDSPRSTDERRTASVLAVDAASGETTASHEFSDAFATSPLVLDGTIYVSSGTNQGRLHALGTPSGDGTW